MAQETEFGTVVEVIQGRFLFAFVRDVTLFAASQGVQDSVCYSIDSELVYEPFYADFGPLNLGHAFKYCRRTAELLQDAARLGKKLLFYSGPSPQHKVNAAVLVGIFQVMLLGRSAAVAHAVVAPMEPFPAFRDASSGAPCFLLRIQHVLAGMERAKAAGFLDWDRADSAFDLAEYEHYEQVENGDLNWIVPRKLLAFSGPSPVARVYYGFKSFTPEDYWAYFRLRGVSAVVRLNKQMYEGRRFVAGGFRQHELYFPDGSCPSEAIVQRFLAIVEAEPGALAVHCKAGLGRTGVLICCYLIKHHSFTAEEAIGYIRGRVAAQGKGPGHAVARALAPNGQPRKLPAALLESPADLAEYAAAGGEECMNLAVNPGPRNGFGSAAGWTIGATMRSLTTVRR
ncbi:hypothetical protein WJX81_000477 [Elliptochloris bilobata]|uniref:protein-tyrosine-phosphatase n=1 Tax=Elliptochloris bilobata TaxID=381761 RepID=A0AAW1S0L3_9CHLO